MAKVRRRVVHDGDTYCVECAVRADRVTSPVAHFLDALKEKTWAPGLGESSHLEPDEQLKAYAWLLVAIEYFAEEGLFPHVGDWNQLMRGIWEIRRWEIRVTFFDTDGRGNYTPKTMDRIVTGGGGYCPLPDFDPFIRLGTVFEKTTPKTPQHELDLAERIRREDLDHDKQE